MPPPTFFFFFANDPPPTHTHIFIFCFQSAPLRISNGIALNHSKSTPSTVQYRRGMHNMQSWNCERYLLMILHNLHSLEKVARHTVRSCWATILNSLTLFHMIRVLKDPRQTNTLIINWLELFTDRRQFLWKRSSIGPTLMELGPNLDGTWMELERTILIVHRVSYL